MDDEYENYYFDDAVGGSEGGYSGDQSNYDSNFSDWNYDDGNYSYAGANDGNIPSDYNPTYDWDQATNEWANQQPSYDYQNQGYTGGTGQADFAANLNNGPGGQPTQGNWYDSLLKGGGNALQNLLAPNARDPNTGNSQLDSIMRMIQAGAGAGKGALGFAAANSEKEKAQKFYEYAKQMQQQSSGALDPAAGLRPIAAQAWQDTNPIMKQLQEGGITANMQQELNAARMEAMRKGGKSGQRFAQFASRQDPYMMAQARKNDFGMQMQALKQRYDEATKGPSAGYTDMLKYTGDAYKQSLTNPMFAAGSKALSDITGGGNSLSGEDMDRLKALLSRQG